MKTRTLHVVDGAKGGTGKSTTAMVVCDYLANQGRISKTFVLDGDLTNPDIFRRFEKSGATVAIGDLRRSEDWLEALESIEAADCDDVVVSLPATADASEITPVIKEIVEALGYRLITYFVIVKNPDCVELLSNSYETGIISISQTYCVILNEIAGKLSEFRGFLSSEIKQKIETDDRCAGILSLPVLYAQAVNALHAAQEYSPSQIRDSGALSLVCRAMLSGWLNKAHEIVAAVTKSIEPVSEAAE